MSYKAMKQMCQDGTLYIFRGHMLLFKKTLSLKIYFFLVNRAEPAVKCRIVRDLIWVFKDCQSTR